MSVDDLISQYAIRYYTKCLNLKSHRITYSFELDESLVEPVSRSKNFCVIADKRAAASSYNFLSSGVNVLSSTAPESDVNGTEPLKTFENKLNFPAISAAFDCAVLILESGGLEGPNCAFLESLSAPMNSFSRALTARYPSVSLSGFA